jgi:integrase
MPKLTKDAVEAAKPAKAKFHLWDSETRGFGLRVMPSGVKTFIVVYRNAGNQKRWWTIGRWGPLTPDMARKEAKRILGKVAAGEDPTAGRAAERRGDTISDLLDRFLADHVEVKGKPKTIHETRRLIERHLRPELGKIKISNLSVDDVDRFHRGMKETPRMANHAIAVLSKALSLAERWKLRPLGSNVCRLVDRYPENKRNRVLTGQERARLGQAIQQAEAERIEPRAALDAMKLLALTGCRLSEIINLAWANVDFERGLFHLVDSKTGPAIRAFGSRTALVLQAMPHLGPWVIPLPTDPNKPMRTDIMENVWRRVRKVAEIPDVRLHDLRHGVGSAAAGLGANAFAIRDLLGHADLQMTGRYVHRDAGLRSLTDRVEMAIGRELLGWADEVVPLQVKDGNK